MQDVLLAEDIYSTPGLLPAIGRLANAMVAVLGPEYSLGSAAYIACKSIINDMRPGEAGAHSWRLHFLGTVWWCFAVLLGLRRLHCTWHSAFLKPRGSSSQLMGHRGACALLLNRTLRDCVMPVGGLWASESPIDEVTAALERVLYTQMLVLFAPKAVPAKSHVQAS